MVNVKLSIAFVIAAAAIAPILAQPIALDGESESLEARALGLDDEKMFASLLEDRVKSLERQDRELTKTRDGLRKENGALKKEDDGLRRTERGLKSANGRLKKENDGLTRTKHTLEKQDGALKREKGHLKGDVRKLNGKRKDLLKADKSLGRKHRNLEKENKKLGRADKKLLREGKVQGRKNAALKTEGKALEKTIKAERKTVATVAKVSKGKLGVREFDEELLERDFEEAEFDARDFEETEFDARDFDEELYLD